MGVADSTSVKQQRALLSLRHSSGQAKKLLIRKDSPHPEAVKLSYSLKSARKHESLHNTSANFLLHHAELKWKSFKIRLLYRLTFES